jgi:beta-galactosidase
MAGVLAAANGVDFLEYPELEKEGFGIGFSGSETTFHPHTILESLTLKGAEAIATFRGGSMEGRPAITRKRYGQGSVFYVGTDSSDNGFYETLARAVGRTAGLSPLIAAPYGVEVVSRENDDTTFYFLLNLTKDAHLNIRLPQPMEDMIAGGGRLTQVSLNPFDVAVLSATKTAEHA